VRQLSIADITLSWVEADMAGIGPTLCRAVAAEHVRDLQRWTRHASRALGGQFGAHFELARDAVERAHDFPDGLGGDTGIERRGVELGVPQYWVALALLAGTLAFVYSSSGLAAGLALGAIRHHEAAAASLGVDIDGVKLAVYVSTAAVTGMVGALTRISPDAAFRARLDGRYHLHHRHRQHRRDGGARRRRAIIFYLMQRYLADFGAWYLVLLGISGFS
jgi:hypothetical protein